MGAGHASGYALCRIERAMRTLTRAPTVFLIVCLAGLLAACAPRLDPRADATQGIFDLAKRHEFAALEARLPPLRRTAVTDARLQAQAALIPDQPPQSVRLVGSNVTRAADGDQIAVTREYLYPDRLLVVSTAIRDQAGKPAEILGFNIQGFNKAALAVGRFSLAGKSPMQYFLLGLAALIPLLLVVALAALARDKTIRWKWLWTIFILIGFTQLSVNWASGAILFEPLGVVLLGASVNRGALDISPWIVTISLPLGALVYLGRLWFAPPPEEAE